MGMFVVGGTRFLLLCVLGLVLSLLVPTKTLAFGESISVSPTSGPTGQAVTIVGTGWHEHAIRGLDVPIWIGFANEVGRGHPDANDSFSVSITIPVNPPPQEIVNGKLTISAIIGNGGSADAFYTISNTPQSSSFSFDVASTKGWQNTSLKVTTGQLISFSVVGSWTVDYRNFPYVGPDGYTPAVDSTIYQGCKLDPTVPYGKLLVRVGDNPSFVAFGSNGAFTADRDGVLAFRIHDGDACLADNAGSVRVTVTGNGFSAPVQTPPPFYVCLSGPGSICQGLYSQPVPEQGAPSLPPWLTSPEAGKCVLTITDRITNGLGLALPELGFLETFYTEAAKAGLPLTRPMTLEESVKYGLILVKAGSEYVISKLGPLVKSQKIETGLLGAIDVIDGCGDWVVSLLKQLPH